MGTKTVDSTYVKARVYTSGASAPGVKNEFRLDSNDFDFICAGVSIKIGIRELLIAFI